MTPIRWPAGTPPRRRPQSGLSTLYRRVQAFADETIDALPLDAIGYVAHWGGAEVSLHEIMVHNVVDLQRHTGHADVLREQFDGSVGLLPGHSNLPDDTDWRRISSDWRRSLTDSIEPRTAPRVPDAGSHLRRSMSSRNISPRAQPPRSG